MSYHDRFLIASGERLARALNLSPAQVAERARALEESFAQKAGPEHGWTNAEILLAALDGWADAELLLAALDNLSRERESSPTVAEADTALVHGDTDYPWIAEVRLGDGRLVSRGAALSWGGALRNALPGILAHPHEGISALPDEQWALTLSGPGEDEANLKKRSLLATFRTRAGVEAAMRASRWSGVRDAMRMEWDARLAAEVEPS